MNEPVFVGSANAYEMLTMLTKGYKIDTLKTRSPKTIVDYKVINDKVVIVTFADGTTEKAVCDDRDNFDLEVAVQVCLLKKILGRDTYYSLMKSASKQIKDIDDKKKKDQELDEWITKKKAQRVEYKKRKAERERQARIDEMSEAFRQAMHDYDTIQIDQNMNDFAEEYERLNESVDNIQNEEDISSDN